VHERSTIIYVCGEISRNGSPFQVVVWRPWLHPGVTIAHSSASRSHAQVSFFKFKLNLSTRFWNRLSTSWLHITSCPMVKRFLLLQTQSASCQIAYAIHAMLRPRGCPNILSESACSVYTGCALHNSHVETLLLNVFGSALRDDATMAAKFDWCGICGNFQKPNHRVQTIRNVTVVLPFLFLALSALRG
jgi:hypothetical protein